MTRKLMEIVDESFDIFMFSLDKFKQDKRFEHGDFHYEWVNCVAKMAEKILVNERISEDTKEEHIRQEQVRQGYYSSKPQMGKGSPRQRSTEGGGYQQPKIKDLITVRLSDGEEKTIMHKDRLKQLGFWWNKPEGSHDWNKRISQDEWAGMASQEPFRSFTIKIEE